VTIVSQEFDHVIGVDTHAKTHTLVVLDCHGARQAGDTFPTNRPRRTSRSSSGTTHLTAEKSTDKSSTQPLPRSDIKRSVNSAANGPE